MINIGWRNLKQSPLRMVIASGGIGFAVVLITCEIGMMFGMTRNASILVDRSNADLLVSSPSNKTFDFASPIYQRKIHQVASVPGVVRVEEFNAVMSIWKLEKGGNAACQVIAFDHKGSLAPALHMNSGEVKDLHNQDAVIIDQSACRMLGNPQIGDTVEILRRRARIVGICRNMQSFSTIPMVFTSLRRGDTYGWIRGGGMDSKNRKSMYFLVQLDPHANIAAVRQAISERVKGVEVHTRESLSWRTRRFWLIETGLGLAFLGVAFLGLMVGGVILSQTLFALTMEKLSEFGVLRALGASMPELATVVLQQGLICGGCGLGLGLLASFGVKSLAKSAGTEIEIGIPLILVVSVTALALSAGASLLSISRLKRMEPAMVFRA